MSELVELGIERQGEVVVARLAGELDLAGAPRVGEQISDAVPTDARGLVVDLGPLEFMDSSGVSMLFGLARRLGGRRQEMHVVAPAGGPVARVLQIVDFGRAAPVHARMDEALAELG